MGGIDRSALERIEPMRKPKIEAAHARDTILAVIVPDTVEPHSLVHVVAGESRRGRSEGEALVDKIIDERIGPGFRSGRKRRGADC